MNLAHEHIESAVHSRAKRVKRRRIVGVAALVVLVATFAVLAPMAFTLSDSEDVASVGIVLQRGSSDVLNAGSAGESASDGSAATQGAPGPIETHQDATYVANEPAQGNDEAGGDEGGSEDAEEQGNEADGEDSASETAADPALTPAAAQAILAASVLTDEYREQARGLAPEVAQAVVDEAPEQPVIEFPDVVAFVKRLFAAPRKAPAALESAIAQGTTGSVNWAVTENDAGEQVLTVWGNGGMESKYDVTVKYVTGKGEYGSSTILTDERPWAEYAKTVKHIVIEEGVTSVGGNAFRAMTGVQDVSLPDSLETVAGYAFAACYGITELHIPQNLRIDQNDRQFCFAYMDLREIVVPAAFAESMTGHAYAFDGNTNLTKIVYEDGSTTMDTTSYRDSKGIEELTLPSTITKVTAGLSSNDLLYTLNFNAAYLPSSNFNYPTLWYSDYHEPRLRIDRTLNIGPDVALLPRAVLASMANGGGKLDVIFEGGNYFESEDMSGAADLKDPLALLNGGVYYADPNSGCVYKIEDGAAKLVYVDPDKSTLTVPAQIPDQDGTMVPVAGVGRHALSLARNLRTIKFANPGAVTALDAGAFADCPTLTSVNGKTAVPEAAASFPNAETNVFTFENTGLTDGGIATVGETITAKNNLEVSVSVRQNSKHQPGSDGDSYYFYTGEAATLTIDVSNPDNRAQGAVARVYINLSDALGGISYEPGDHTFTINNHEYQVRVFETEIPGTYCFEIPTPEEGDTISLTPTMAFPSPNSAGGSARISVNILSADELAALEQAGKRDTFLAPMTVTNESGDTGTFQQLVQWVTKRDAFPLGKTVTSGTAAKIEGVQGAGEVAVKNLSFTITTAREEDTLEGIGKDYVRRQIYTDTFALPEGLAWSQDFKQAVRSGKVEWVYYDAKFVDPEDRSHVYLTFSADMKYGTVEIWLTDDDKLVTRWEKTNRAPQQVQDDHETESHTIRYVLGDDVVVVADPAQLATGDEFTLRNDVSVTQHYSYTEPVTQSTHAETTVVATEPKLEFFKSAKTYPTYFGDDAGFALTLKNTGAVRAEADSVAFSDEMTKYFYIKPENIDAMFADPEGGSELSITVTKGLVWGSDAPGDVQPGAEVTAIDGTGGHVLPVTLFDGVDNSAAKFNGLHKDALLQLSDQAKLVFTRNAATGLVEIEVFEIEDVLEHAVLTVGEGGQFASAADALASIGFAVGHHTTYKVEWKHADAFVLASNQMIERVILASVKDTFMMLTEDAEERYDKSTTSAFKTSNAATATLGDSAKKMSASISSISLYRDFDFDKSSKINGQELIKENIGDNAIVDYTVTWSHVGMAEYDAVPVVDHMQNGQALLVPADQNPGLAVQQLSQVTVGGVSYYILNRPGTYRNVRVGQPAEGDECYLADSVLVTDDGSGGWDTVVKWYFPVTRAEYRSQSTGASIGLKSLVKFSWADGQAGDEDGNNATVKVNNEAYLGDHMGHRLWEHVGCPFHRYRIQKSVVESLGADESDPSDDKLAASSVLYEGQKVTYRLDFMNNSDSIALISASNLYDKLPLSVEGHRWSAENVSVSYVDAGAFSYPQVSGTRNWYIETDADNPDQQYLKWHPGTSFVIAPHGWGYVYVTLTMPQGDAWDAYCADRSLTGVENTMYLFGEDSTVHHDLNVPAKAVIHKGVVKTGSAVMAGGGSVAAGSYVENDGVTSRAHYANDDYRARFVTYYSTIYNDGTSRLYLDNIQDRLPRGFTLYMLGAMTTSNTSPSTTRTAYIGASVLSQGSDSSRAQVKYLKHREEATTRIAAGGYQVVKFAISQTSAAGAEPDQWVNYDPDTDRCYLLPGQAIELVYTCRTNNADATDDFATNIVGLEVDARSASRLEVDDATFQLKDPGAIERNESEACLTESASAVATYGFTGEADSNWLVAEVSVERGSILPGITKTALKRTSSSGIEEDHPHSAEPQDTITWQVLAENDGTLPISDYVITDVMQAPYIFTGKVGYSLWRAGRQYSDVDFGNPHLFEFGEREEVDGQTRVRIIKPDYAGNAKTWLTVGGEPLEYATTMKVYKSKDSKTSFDRVSVKIYVSLDVDENGNEVLQIRFPDGLQSITEDGGMGILSVSTVKPVNDHENKVYYNTSYITPLTQTYNGRQVTRGNDSAYPVDWTGPDGAVTMDDERASVRNSVPISVAFGYATSAVKTVEQADDPENKAYSDQPTNSFITLPAKDTKFTYTVLVGNTTDLPMDKLVLIDNLPQVDDHSTFVKQITRESRFKVSFVDDFKSGIQVAVTDKDGNEKVLDPSDYVIDFSTATEFGEGDWDGLDNTSAGWSSSADPATTRSLRLRINDPAGTLIPAWSTVSMRFTCRVDDPAAVPGDKAWNSFGYHYKLKGKSNELEAAPLNVGVQFPNIPFIQKQLIDRRNKPVEAAENETFRFIVFDGTPDDLDVPGSAGSPTDGNLLAALSGTRSFTYVELPVQAGKTASAEVLLDGAKRYTYVPGSGGGTVKETSAPFAWASGRSYTAFELTDELQAQNGSDWFFHSIDLGSGNSTARLFTFEYDPSRNQVIVGRNAFEDWDVVLRKHGRNSTSEDLAVTLLGGAVFGLYSPFAGDALTDDEFAALAAAYDLSPSVARTVSHAGYDYYLSDVAATIENSGSLLWEALTQESYVVAELKAPDGYVADDGSKNIFVAKADAENHAILKDVYNEVAYDLPLTGGMGVHLFRIVGIIVMASFGIAFVVRRYRHRLDAHL